jgi:hypothetical protein
MACSSAEAVCVQAASAVRVACAAQHGTPRSNVPGAQRHPRESCRQPRAHRYTSVNSGSWRRRAAARYIPAMLKIKMRGRRCYGKDVNRPSTQRRSDPTAMVQYAAADGGSNANIRRA